MAIHIFAEWVTRLLPTGYYVPAAAALCLLYSLNFIANGRKNPRDRDMHGRVVLLTGAFTPLGLTLMHELAQRGAQIIALTPSLNDPVIEELISAIRAVTSNELIFAEECDLSSPSSIRAFCKQFLTTTASGPSSNIPGAPRDPPRLDSIILAHEYTHIGSLWTSSKDTRRMETERRFEGSLASFLLITLLLPCLIKAPSDRDIRVVSVVNPLYAASIPTYLPPLALSKPDTNTSPSNSQSKTAPDPPLPQGVPEPVHPSTPFQNQLARMALSSISSREGERALRSILLMRHLQRVVDALASQSTRPVLGTSDADLVDVKKMKTSNILAVSAAPGFSRPQTIGSYLRAKRELEDYSPLGFFLYILLFPLICLFSKSSVGAAQTVLYALFAPTVRTRIAETPDESSTSTPGTSSEPIPRIQGGILYRECAATRLPGRGMALMEAEGIGRAVWEELERGVEIWEKSEGEVLREMAKEVEREGKESSSNKPK